MRSQEANTNKITSEVERNIVGGSASQQRMQVQKANKVREEAPQSANLRRTRSFEP